MLARIIRTRNDRGDLYGLEICIGNDHALLDVALHRAEKDGPRSLKETGDARVIAACPSTNGKACKPAKPSLDWQQYEVSDETMAKIERSRKRFDSTSRSSMSPVLHPQPAL